MLIGRHFLIRGRVQGVFFRRFTNIQAKALGITGWVRNLPDGRVEVKAYGTEDQLTTLTQKLHKGPRAAKVTEVLIEEIPVEGRMRFEVLES